jgi:hypothetical protein
MDASNHVYSAEQELALRQEALDLIKDATVCQSLQGLRIGLSLCALSKQVLHRILSDENASPLLFDWLVLAQKVAAAKAGESLDLQGLRDDLQTIARDLVADEISRATSVSNTAEIVSAAKSRKLLCHVKLPTAKNESDRLVVHGPGELLLLIGEANVVNTALLDLVYTDDHYVYADGTAVAGNDMLLFFHHFLPEDNDKSKDVVKIGCANWMHKTTTAKAWRDIIRSSAEGRRKFFSFVSSVGLVVPRKHNELISRSARKVKTASSIRRPCTTIKHAITIINNYVASTSERTVAGVFVNADDEAVISSIKRHAEKRTGVRVVELA